jgi:hypothetical protein
LLQFAGNQANPTDFMTDHQHRHHHRHPVVVPGSLLRMSVLQRLAVAGGVIAVMWAAVVWAMN